MFLKSARIMAVALIVVVGCAEASKANQRVVVDLPALAGPWTNPYVDLPQFKRLAERLEAKVEEGDDAVALVLEATLLRSSDFPILMGADWSGEVPLDRLTLWVENRGEADVRVGVILVLQDERRISTSFEALSSGQTETLEYSMLDAKPPQSPGKLASVSRIEVAIRGLRAQVDYCVGFGDLTFDALAPVASVALSAVELTARAGDRIRLEWPATEGRLPEGDFQVELTVENRQEIFLEASTRLVEADGTVILEPVEITLPRRMPGAEYEIFVDTRRVPIAGEPLGRASVGSLLVEELPPGKPIRAKVAPWHGAPAFHFDGKPHDGLMYMTYHLGGDYVRQFAGTGVDVVSFDTACGYHPYGLTSITWPEQNVFDFTQCDAHATRILAAHPEAKLLIRTYVACPPWWAEANPNELVTVMKPDGTKVPFEKIRGYRPGSWASEKWRRDMGRVVARFVRHLRRASYSDRVVGLMVCAGVTEEWMMFGSNSAMATDYSAPTVAAFRRWVQAKYETEQRLRRAWARKDLSFEAVEPPTPEELVASVKGDFLELPRGEPVSDWWRFLSDTTAEAIEHFGRIVKTESDGDWLYGTFYGYVMQFHGPRIVTSGHLAIDRLARSKDVDFFFSPALYSHRSLKPGGYSTHMSLTDTYHLNGKLWCNENDIRTFRVMDVPNVNADQIDRRQTPEETVALLRRELGGVLAHGSAQSYFDMGGGWYDDAGLLDEVRAQVAVARKMLDRDRSSAAEVAVVVDPDAFTRQRLGTRANTWGILGQVASLGAMGAPFDLISLADVDRLPPRKLWIFLNLFAPTHDQIERVHRRLKRDKATALFVYASGLLSPNDGMRRLTGMTIGVEYGPRCADVRVPAESLGIGREVTYGTSSPVGPADLGPGHVSPTFYIDDPETETLGTDPATGKPGLSRQSMDGWTSVYSAAPGVAAPVLRALCRQAGVHVYVEEGAVVYANNSMLSVTVTGAGRRTIRLKKPASVTNAITGRTVAENVSQFHIDFDQRQSKLFLLTPAKDE